MARKCLSIMKSSWGAQKNKHTACSLMIFLMKKLWLELVYWTIQWWVFFVISNMLVNECVCKKCLFVWLVWLSPPNVAGRQKSVCYLTSSPFSPPGRHILKSPCGWSHVCSERLRETEHNSDLNNWITQTTHLPNQTFLDTWNDFHPSLESI